MALLPWPFDPMIHVVGLVKSMGCVYGRKSLRVMERIFIEYPLGGTLGSLQVQDDVCFRCPVESEYIHLYLPIFIIFPRHVYT